MDGATSRAKNPLSSLIDSLVPTLPPLINVSLAIGNVSVTKTPACPTGGNQPSKGSSTTSGSKDAGADKGSPTTNGSKDTTNGSKNAGPDNRSSTTNGSNGTKN